jgi:hypothetical protein
MHNMAREAPRTLYSLSAKYQQDIVAEYLEVIVVDNSSTLPLDSTILKDLGDNFHLVLSVSLTVLWLYPLPLEVILSW